MGGSQHEAFACNCAPFVKVPLKVRLSGTSSISFGPALQNSCSPKSSVGGSNITSFLSWPFVLLCCIGCTLLPFVPCLWSQGFSKWRGQGLRQGRVEINKLLNRESERARGSGLPENATQSHPEVDKVSSSLVLHRADERRGSRYEVPGPGGGAGKGDCWAAESPSSPFISALRTVVAALAMKSWFCIPYGSAAAAAACFNQSWHNGDMGALRQAQRRERDESK